MTMTMTIMGSRCHINTVSVNRRKHHLVLVKLPDIRSDGIKIPHNRIRNEPGLYQTQPSVSITDSVRKVLCCCRVLDSLPLHDDCTRVGDGAGRMGWLG